MPAAMTYASLKASAKNYAERPDDDSLDEELPTLILFAQRRIAREVKVLGLQKYVVSTFTASNGVINKPTGWLQTLSVNYGASKGMVTSVTVNDEGEDYVPPLTFTTSGGAGSGATFAGIVINGAITQVVPDDGGDGFTSAPTLTVEGFDGSGSGASLTAVISTTNQSRVLLYERAYEYCTAYWPNRAQTGFPQFYADYGFNNWLVVPTPPDSVTPFEIAMYVVDDLLSDEQQTNWLTLNAPDMLLYATMVEMGIFLKDQSMIERWTGFFDRAAKGFGAEDKGRITDRTADREK